MFEADTRPGAHVNTVSFSSSHNHQKPVDLTRMLPSVLEVEFFLADGHGVTGICEQISWY